MRPCIPVSLVVDGHNRKAGESTAVAFHEKQLVNAQNYVQHKGKRLENTLLPSTSRI